MPARGINQSQLLKVTIEEGTKVFQDIQLKYTNENFYSFCLGTDNDVTSVFPMANTEEALNRISADEKGDPIAVKAYRWSPEEWDIEFNEAEFEKTNSILFPDYTIHENDNNFIERKRQTIETLTKALYEIKNNGVFAGQKNASQISFFVSIGDAEEYEINMMIDSLSKYNNDSTINDLKWLYLED